MLPICLARHRSIIFYSIVLMLVVPNYCGPRYSSRIVEIQTGAIRGIILELSSRHLEPVEVFRGVPYAAPPVGPFRFRPPQPPLTWPGTRLADTFGAACPQKYPDISNRTAALHFMPKGRYQYLKKLVPLLVNQSEDCLFLNIYVPGSGNRGLEAPYAVLVFIHGESFEWGAGHPYDGSVLASYGHVIVVTLNFRLGVLGFLRTRFIDSSLLAEDKNWDSSGGNLGLKDIAAALKWIKVNIAAFGGDPNRVTLVGHDTGAALANLLLISPSAKGLFRRVLLLSGTALSPWATIRNANSLRTSVGQQTGCLPMETGSQQREEESDIAGCLRSRPLQALLEVQLEKVRFMPRIAPSLPIESDATDPAYAMEHASENFITCEVMLGTTTTESYSDFSANDIQYGFEEDQRNRVLRTYIRNAYVYHLNEIFSAVKNEYTDWDKPIQHPINIRDSTMEALSDGHTVSPLVRVAYLHARRGARTYFFHFGYQTKDSDYPQRLGSIRGEDLTYILGLPLVGGLPHFPQNFSRQDVGIAEAMLNFISNFAKSGDPNVPSVDNKDLAPDYGSNREKTRYKGLVWDPYEIGTQFYLSVTSKPKMKSHYRGHKMAVWLNLIPQLHQPGDDDVTMRHHHFHEREPHYYAGAVRVESFTRLPPPLHPASMTDSHAASSGEGTECIPNTTSDEDIQVDKVDDLDEENEEFLQRLATRHYYSYTAALGVTVGVGCLLLVLNMLIFAGIYYQRERDRHRQNQSSRSRQTGSNSNATAEAIPMSQRPSTPGSSAQQSPMLTKKEKTDFPPSYTMIPANLDCNTLPKREKPPPPVRTSSNPPGGTVKKRVQIQEISV
ncbi:neuroligin-4, X-linked-like isoform X1 [Diorhabda carinulata]|uniref:neuroligin-4, X-linked-like isoform X1 n=1 Tax=Diorhabda carinulata TaxID=1163345 RepID=UPI0025A0442F|nr:neuroligin-4, X-linked-like isoform X1 [Diorhabda carinulata]XP_057662591.1 neuroligin-4, X-linked-like isoform X1 [Diorhabda carinulata]